jgi:cytochrome b subunit of formate dehydrogenase
MGSSGAKKSRKGKQRQHLAKVGTPTENSHAMHSAERDVVGNFGIRGKGLMFWIAVVVIVVIAIGGIVTLALL